MDDKLAAKFPLKEIQVTAEPVPGKPGMFKSEIQMIPHFKLKGVEDELERLRRYIQEMEDEQGDAADEDNAREDEPDDQAEDS